MQTTAKFPPERGALVKTTEAVLETRLGSMPHLNTVRRASVHSHSRKWVGSINTCTSLIAHNCTSQGGPLQAASGSQGGRSDTWSVMDVSRDNRRTKAKPPKKQRRHAHLMHAVPKDDPLQDLACLEIQKQLG